MTLFRFNHCGLTTNKFSTDIVWTLSKTNRVSIALPAKFVEHVRCPTIILHPAISNYDYLSRINLFLLISNIVIGNIIYTN